MWGDVKCVALMVLLVTQGFMPARGGAGRKSAGAPDSTHKGDAGRPVVLRFAGDCLIGGRYEEAFSDQPGRLFADSSLFFTADVAMVNLECPFTMRGSKVEKPYNFRADPRTVEGLVNSGITLVNIANNHIYDYGREGLFDTISYLDSVGIGHVGAGADRKRARSAVVLSLAGMRVGFVGYYGGGESPEATADSPGVARRDFASATADLKRLKEQDSVDYIVVNVHWGTEKADRPDREQIVCAHALIDAGADAVIGHHPHVLQGIERYKQGVVAYSLGNFIFGGNSVRTYDSAIFEIRLDRAVAEFRAIPIRVRNWRASILPGAAGDTLLSRLGELSSIFPRTIVYLKETE